MILITLIITVIIILYLIAYLSQLPFFTGIYPDTIPVCPSNCSYNYFNTTLNKCVCGENNKQTCKSLDSINNSYEIKDILTCYLNNEKSIFKPKLNPSEILSGTCNVSRLKDRCVNNIYNQVVNVPCTDCHLQGAEVWFDCDGYSSQFGCYFTIYQNQSFSEIYCPIGV